MLCDEIKFNTVIDYETDKILIKHLNEKKSG